MDTSDPIALALLALKHGDPASRDEAVRTLKKLVAPVAYRTANRYREYRLEASDLAQAIHFRLLDLAAEYEYDPARPAAPLVTCVARRAALSAAQALARQRPINMWSLDYDLFRGGNRDGHYTVGDVLADPDALNPADAVADGADARLALRLLRSLLSRFELAVWIARHIHERPYDEIAVALSVGRRKPYTLRSIDNAEQRTREKLERIRRVRRSDDPECRMEGRRV